MLLIIFLTLILIGAMATLSVLDRIDQKVRRERLRLRRLQSYSEDVQDILATLIETVPETPIILAINGYLIELFEEMLTVDEAPVESIRLALDTAHERQTQWTEGSVFRQTQYARDSDAQIARTQLQITAAMELLPLLASKGKVSASDLELHINQLRWAHLMVSVMSFIAQGERSMAISDRFSAYNFYRKAQQLLMESLHNDPRRVKIIKQLSEIIEGNRDQLSNEFRHQGTEAEATTTN